MFVMKAFPAGSAFTYWWSPSLSTMHAWHASRIVGRFGDPSTQQFKVVDNATGSIVAFAKWDPPATMSGFRPGFVVYDEDGRPVSGMGKEGKEGKGKKQAPLQAPDGADPKLYEEFFNGLKRMGEKWRTSEKLCLSIICTDPAYHGCGIGAALIRSGLAIADAEGVSAYLEGLPLAVPLYRRLGFEPVDKLEYDITRAGMEGTAVLTIMVREPGAGVTPPA
ncbi:hypothetical protein F5Y04DRAFT_114657 [Hypomontagnella monticulosa]|nr:hypothetical protein F5Y04DRAFT_114657 [Hypomontagnella monticulosa]